MQREMISDDFDELMAEAQARPFVGWDVRYGGRINSCQPWSFTAIVAALAHDSPDLLDLGTGGGEWLASLPHRPPRTVATEGWPPNVPIAQARLAPLGIDVFGVEAATPNIEQRAGTAGGALPFADASFHLVTDRHESYLPAELHRVLAPGGIFVTQQVGSGASDDYYRLFNVPVPVDPLRWTLDFARWQLETAGFAIEDAAEGFDEIRFADVGALAWYLKNLPFVFPGFTIEDRRDRLAELHRDGPITVRLPIFWLRARRY